MNSVLWLCHHLLIHVRRAERYKPKAARRAVYYVALDNGACHDTELREVIMKAGVVNTMGEPAHEDFVACQTRAAAAAAAAAALSSDRPC